MLRLTTFGGVRLARGREALTGAATQRRRLAILALLAVAGERGVSRDKLVGLLWAESEEERARHVLNQLLYAQRQYFEEERLFLGKKTLRLNPAVIWADVAAFEAALAKGELVEAASYYQGPFLDGFFLNDAPGFEEWADAQRDRFKRRLREAWSGRAAALEQQGEPGQAADCWRHVAELDPLDSVVARKLVEALAAAGDRGGAMRQARRHAGLLKAELGLEPDLEFRRLLQRIEQGEAR
jgi:DNA-binding SARP family transcriptional activator